MKAREFNYKYIFILSFTILLGMVSCDKIEEEDYMEPLAEREWKGQRVLLEDYTGHKCLNCPKAVEIADGLKKLYGDKLIVVSVHASGFALPYEEYPQDFRTPEGTFWNEFFKISPEGLPAGMVNRISFNGKKRCQYSDWAQLVKEKIYEEPTIDLELSVSYNEASRSATIDATASFLTDIDKSLNIGALLLQDSIIGPQTNGSETIHDFVFNHVLRQTIEGQWGKSFVDKPSAKTKKSYKSTFTVVDSLPAISAARYNSKTPIIPKNCHVVVYIATGTPSSAGDINYKIIQAIEMPLMSDSQKK